MQAVTMMIILRVAVGASACCSRPQNRAVMSVLPVPWPDEAHIAAWGVTRQDLPGAASGDAAPT